MSSRRNRVAVLATAAVAVTVLAACSSGSSASMPQSAIAAASSAAAAAASADAAGAGLAGTDAMRALCDQMVAGGMSPEEATALAESNGFVARVGTIDGAPQALSMDYRDDRFTFDVEGGAVAGCTYG